MRGRSPPTRPDSSRRPRTTPAGRPSSSTRTTGCCSPQRLGDRDPLHAGRQQHALRGQPRRSAGERQELHPLHGAGRDQRLHLSARSRALGERRPVQRRPGAGQAHHPRDRRQRQLGRRQPDLPSPVHAGRHHGRALLLDHQRRSTAIMRWDFGGSTTAAVQYLTPTNTDGKTCVGCHALAPDGTKLVASAGGQNDGRLLLWNVSTNLAHAAVPADAEEPVRVLEQRRHPVRRDLRRRQPEHQGPGQPDDLRRDERPVTQTIDLGGLRADHPDWSKNTSGPDTIVFTSVDPTVSTTDQRPATRRDRLRPAERHDLGRPRRCWSRRSPARTATTRPSARTATLVVYDESTCDAGDHLAALRPATPTPTRRRPCS